MTEVFARAAEHGPVGTATLTAPVAAWVLGLTWSEALLGDQEAGAAGSQDSLMTRNRTYPERPG